jgi:hypothetical protein
MTLLVAAPGVGHRPTRPSAHAAEAVSRPQLPSSRPCSDAVNSQPRSFLGGDCARSVRSALSASAATEQQTEGAAARLPSPEANVEAAPGNGAYLLAGEHEWVPEAFHCEPGELTPVERHATAAEHTTPFRCSGCTRPECQVSTLHAYCNLQSVQIQNAPLSTGCLCCCRAPVAVQPLIGPLQQRLPVTTCGRSCGLGYMKSR